MINLITDLISFTQPTNLDKESLSVIESIAKIKKVVNECITQFNNLEEKTEEDYNNFLKQIKDYKNYIENLCKQYKNETLEIIQEFKELIKALEDIEKTVEWIKEQSEFIQDLAKYNQNQIDKGTVATVEQIKQLKYYYTPLMFEGNLKTTIENALNDDKGVITTETTIISEPIIIEGNQKYLKVNLTITPTTSGIHFKNLHGGDISITILGGGNENIESYGVKFTNCVGINAKIHGEGYRGTVLMNGGANQDNTFIGKSHFTVVAIKDKNDIGCMRCLKHGGDNETLFQGAFGTYDNIIDFNSSEGSVIQYSNDITIVHYENLYWDSTRTKIGLLLNKVRAIHCDNIAVGGRNKANLKIIDCSISINKLFTMSEDNNNTGYITDGVIIEGENNIVNCLYYYDNKSNNALTLNNIGSSIINFMNIFAYSSHTNSVVTIDGTSLNFPQRCSYYTQCNPVGSIDILNKSGAYVKYRYKDLPNIAQFIVGVSDGGEEYKIVVVDKNNTIKGTPLKINTAGTIRVGTPEGKIGFYDQLGTTRQTINNAASDVGTACELVNNIRNILLNLGLVQKKEETAE